MTKWRLIVDEGDPYWNMALDEAMLLLKDRGKVPNTLRLYVFKPSSVSIGYFQKVNEAVDLNVLNSLRVPLVRRITGGGSVYHDERGEITYSLVANLRDFPRDILLSYKAICKGLIYALAELGLEASFLPVNDVVINCKKVSCSAQVRKPNALLQHGTLMYATDLEVLAKVLKAPKLKLSSHRISSIYERVTTVARELGYRPRKEEVIRALIRGFEGALGVELIEDEITEEERKLAVKLKLKYESRNWNFKR